MPTKDHLASSPDQCPDAIRKHAFDTFGTEAKTLHWLHRPNHLFGGKTPVETLATEPHTVEEELVRIDHGIVV